MGFFPYALKAVCVTLGLYSVEALGIKAFQSTCLATEHQNCNGLEAVSCIIKAIKRSGTAANTRKAEDQACLDACFRVILQSSNILISDRGHLQPSAGSPDCVRATPAVSELCLVHCDLRGISSSLVNAASVAARSNAVLRLPGVTVPLNAHCSIYSMAQPKQVLLPRRSWYVQYVLKGTCLQMAAGIPMHKQQPHLAQCIAVLWNRSFMFERMHPSEKQHANIPSHTLHLARFQPS